MQSPAPLMISHLLRTPLANTPDQLIIHGDVLRYSYRQFRSRLGRLANALRKLGVGQGGVVGVLDWDSHRYLECYFAVPMMGAVLHTVNIRLTPEQILYTINHAQDDVLLIHVDFWDIWQSIAHRVTRRVKIVCLSDTTIFDENLTDLTEYETLLAQSDPTFVFDDFDENTRATLFYTTGTTGAPKAVGYSHRQIVLHSLGFLATLAPVPGQGGLHRGDVYMPLTPLFHVHGWGFPYIATLLGLRQIYPGRYEPARLLALIAEHGVTFSHCVPTILNMLLSAPESAGTDLSRWKVLIGGAALTPALAQAALKRGIDVHAAYGMSETCPLLSVADMMSTGHLGDAATKDSAALDTRIATGRAAPLVEFQIWDENQKVLPHDGQSVGQIVARAPWLTCGYINPSENDSNTSDLWHKGWLQTGDVGAITSDGTLQISDRLKDVIKSGGEWLSSLSLEQLATRVCGVTNAAAIGVPDSRWGERPCLGVEVLDHSQQHFTKIESDIRAIFLREIEQGRLPKWAMPDRIVAFDCLPKTSVGKIDKKALRIIFAAVDT